MTKVPCGGFKLDENFLSMNENDELSLTGKGSEGKAYQYLVTDGDGNTKWEDRLAYEYTEWKDFTLNSVPIPIDGFVMLPIGDTVIVKVNGVERAETVKLGEMAGKPYAYIGTIDFAGLFSGTNGWCIAYNTDLCKIMGAANPETTISLIVVTQSKIKYEYLPDDFLKSPYPIRIVDFNNFLYSFGIKSIVGNSEVGTNNFSLSKEKWDEFLNLLDEFKDNTLCVSNDLIVNNVKSSAGHPNFNSTQMGMSSLNTVSFSYYELDVSYNEETETVTTIKSVTNKDLT